MRVLSESLQRMIDEAVASHTVTSPNHAAVLLRRTEGEVQSLLLRAEDDRVVLAYELRDALKRLFGLLLALKQWSDTYIEATPDEIEIWSNETCH